MHALVASTDDYIYVCNMAEDPSTFLYSQAMVKEFGLPHQVIHDAALEWGKHIHEADQQAFWKLIWPLQIIAVIVIMWNTVLRIAVGSGYGSDVGDMWSGI